jgi:hypothetical protein
LLLLVLLPKIVIAVDGTDIMLLHKHVQDLKKKMTVAGSVTLATTAIGAGVNIALASKLASTDSGGVSASGSGMPKDGRSQE